MNLTRRRVTQLLRELKGLRGDEALLFIAERLRELQELPRSIAWEQAFLVYYARREWTRASRDLKNQYFLAESWLEAETGFKSRPEHVKVAEFVLNELHLLPQGFDPFACAFWRFRTALPCIREGRMDDELWIALRDPTLTEKEFRKLVRDKCPQRKKTDSQGTS